MPYKEHNKNVFLKVENVSPCLASELIDVYHGLQVNTAANLSPGKFTLTASARLNKKRLMEKSKEVTRKYKRRRLDLKSARTLKSTVSSVQEGETYQTDVDLLTSAPDIQEIPPQVIIDGKETTVFFDLETTGFGTNADIVQIAAVSGDRSYSAYVIPKKRMSVQASQVTKIEVRGSKLFHHGQEVSVVTLKDALLGFKGFVEDLNSPLLLGHNIAAFDIPILCNNFRKLNISYATSFKGCVDTLTLARKLYEKGKDVSDHKQSTLVSELLHETYDAHNALADVAALQKLYVTKLKPPSSVLQELLFHINTHICLPSVKVLTDKKILSKALASRMCKSGLALPHLKLAFQRGGDDGVRSLLKEKVAGRIRVTSARNKLDAVVNFLNS